MNYFRKKALSLMFARCLTKYTPEVSTAQNTKFFFYKGFLQEIRIWLHLLNKSLIENFIFVNFSLKLNFTYIQAFRNVRLSRILEISFCSLYVALIKQKKDTGKISFTEWNKYIKQVNFGWVNKKESTSRASLNRYIWLSISTGSREKHQIY